MRKLLLILVYLNVCHLTSAQSIIIQEKHTDKNYTLTAINNMACPATLIATADSMHMQFKKYLPQHANRILVRLPMDTINISAIDRVLNYRLILGNPDAVHDNSYQYNLPFPVGVTHELMQGNNGWFSHNTTRARYAFDFKMPVGSLVTAARGGVVVYVEERFSKGGDNKMLKDRGNQIAICQDDGTIAVYAHIKHNGAIVKVGDPVFAGEPIAFSGNTGFTTGPHLHFAVLVADSSVAIHFRGLKNPLVAGRMYTNNGNFQ